MTKAYKGQGMEGFVAKWYATNTRKGLGVYQALARKVAADLRPGGHVLEVAPGPGYFAIELAKLGKYRVDGLDISKTFVEIAARNAKEANVGAAFLGGDASSMPYPTLTFVRSSFAQTPLTWRFASKNEEQLPVAGRARHSGELPPDSRLFKLCGVARTAFCRSPAA
jgi:ubiquinone/menaquinone biosynthesis C-methylase UbiE